MKKYAWYQNNNISISRNINIKYRYLKIERAKYNTHYEIRNEDTTKTNSLLMSDDNDVMTISAMKKI